MNIMTYRALEVAGTLFVCLVVGMAVQIACWLYAFIKTTAISSLAFTLGFPAFCTSLSMMTTWLKWGIIGKYKPQALARYSMGFFKWWVMDRLVETWEGWVAIFLYETPFLTQFYIGAGANLDWSANVATSFRDFDLVSIGADADVNGTIVTHLVTPQGVIFHKVHIGVACKTDTKAIIGPNVSMEDGSTLDKCEVALSGSIVKAPAEPRQPDRAAACRLQLYQMTLNLVGGMAFMGKFISPHATWAAEEVRMSTAWTYLGANASLEGPYFLDALRWVSYYMVFLWGLGFPASCLAHRLQVDLLWSFEGWTQNWRVEVGSWCVHVPVVVEFELCFLPAVLGRLHSARHHSLQRLRCQCLLQDRDSFPSEHGPTSCRFHNHQGWRFHVQRKVPPSYS